MVRKFALIATLAALLSTPTAAFAWHGHGGGWHGGHWHGGWHGGRWWHGRDWGYGAGPCWVWAPGGWAWSCY